MLKNEMEKFLKKLREEAEMTQERLGEKAKLDLTYISDLERGKYSPSVEVLFRLAQPLRSRASSIVSSLERQLRRGN